MITHLLSETVFYSWRLRLTQRKRRWFCEGINTKAKGINTSKSTHFQMAHMLPEYSATELSPHNPYGNLCLGFCTLPAPRAEMQCLRTAPPSPLRQTQHLLVIHVRAYVELESHDERLRRSLYLHVDSSHRMSVYVLVLRERKVWRELPDVRCRKMQDSGVPFDLSTNLQDDRCTARMDAPVSWHAGTPPSCLLQVHERVTSAGVSRQGQLLRNMRH